MAELSERVSNDLNAYNSMIDEWVAGLLSLKIEPKECCIKEINKRKKRFYFIHYKRGTKGIKHLANMMLDHLEKEQRNFYAYEKKKEEESNGNDV